MNLVDRATCNLRAPRKAVYRMAFPVGELWLHHTVTNPTNDVCADWRYVQKLHFDNGWADIGYSYGIHPKGVVLVGRGDNIGAHTEGRNSRSLGVVLIGDHTKRVVFPEQITAMRQLVHWLINTGRLKAGVYPTGGHQNVLKTACPGSYGMQALAEMREPWAEVHPPPNPPAEGVTVANSPFACLLVHPNGGYLEIGEDGGVFNYNAVFHGSLGGTRLNAPIVAAAWTPDYGGYWMVGADGGVFQFGNAQFFGSTGGIQLNQPITDIKPTPSGAGYYLLGRDGGVFAFGDARHQGNALWNG